jgi:CheY-like chemotaxis protein
MIVLLVEDHEDTREVHSMFLRSKGLKVEIAVKGDEAIAKARAIKPDVVVMDMGLPGVDGWEATRRLKARRGTAHIPVVAISAHASLTDEARAHAVGCAVFLRKPCTPDDLLQAIESVKPLWTRGRRSPPAETDVISSLPFRPRAASGLRL